MNIFQAGILGLVEGLTEFLPISSTFHMIIASKILGLSQNEFQTMFEVVIQSGAILAAVILYAKTLITDRTLLVKILCAFIPTSIVGLLLYKVIKGVFFQSNTLMLIAFGVVGALFIIFEYLIKKEKIKLHGMMQDITYKGAVITGLFQSLAILPGVSRAGAVLVGLMLLGIKREEAAKFSFMLAIPTLLAASVLDIYKDRSVIMHAGPNGLLLLGVGTVMAFVSAYAVITWFIRFLQHHTLIPFGIYRLVIIPFLLMIGL